MARTLIDLSHTISHGMITDPRLPTPVVRDVWTREQSAARYAQGVSFQIASVEVVQNTGTYLDAPWHRHEGLPGVWNIPLESVADLPGVVLDFRKPAAAGRRSIDVADLKGLDLRAAALLVCTGWDQRWESDHYRDNSHPFLSESAGAYLAEHKAALFGLDAINADNFEDTRRPAHTILLGAGIPIVENLTGLERLIGKRFRFTAAPARFEGLGSFPVRAYASVEN